MEQDISFFIKDINIATLSDLNGRKPSFGIVLGLVGTCMDVGDAVHSKEGFLLMNDVDCLIETGFKPALGDLVQCLLGKMKGDIRSHKKCDESDGQGDPQ